MSKLVCVVDDDDEVRAKIAADLRSMGFETIEIGDGREVGEALAAHPVGALVIDIVMPNKDGIEVIGEARRDWPELRIVAISAGGRVGPSLYLEIARQMGADVCLEKPVSPEQLLAALDDPAPSSSGISAAVKPGEA
jgi:CheY-like chemotaxis protein